jgi:hypothetical protein
MWRFRHVCAPLLQSDHAAGREEASHLRHPDHRGCKTGRTYRTPINVFRRGNDYFFFLTYGSDVQWVKNILATGSCSIETGGRVVELVEPERSPIRSSVPRRLTSASSSGGSSGVARGQFSVAMLNA